MKVWIIQTGEYEQAYVFGVAATYDDAIKCIKQTYASPYIVEWDDPKDNCIKGVFASVPGYAMAHTAYFYISEAEVFGTT